MNRVMVVFQVFMADRVDKDAPYWRDFYEAEGSEAQVGETIEQWKAEAKRFACPVRIIERTERDILNVDEKAA